MAHIENILPWWLSGKESACQCRRHRSHPWARKTPWRRKWQPTPVLKKKERKKENILLLFLQFSSVQMISHVRLFGTPWTAAQQASLSFTISQSLLKLISIESVMPSNHLVLHHPLLLLPSIFPSIRILFNELTLRIRWPK